MNIELMKKLEDLKMLRGELSAKLGEQIEIKKDQYIQTVKSDFADFFKEKGFQIDSNDSSVTATYGNLVARLSHKEPETQFLGCYFVFDLNLKAFDGKEYSIILSKSEPRSNVSVSFKDPKGPSDSELQKEIESMQTSIRQSQERLDNFTKEEWELFIKKDPAERSGLLSKGYRSMIELLSSMIE